MNSLFVKTINDFIKNLKYYRQLETNNKENSTLNSFEKSKENLKDKWSKKLKYVKYYTKLSKGQYRIVIFLAVIFLIIIMFTVVHRFILSCCISVNIVLLGFMCIEYYNKKASNEISEGIVPLVMGINANYSQTGDIFEAIRQTTSKMSPSIIKDQVFLLIGKINNGYGVEMAFQSLIDDTEHRTFRYVLLNFKEISVNQCDGEHLLMALESELMDFNHQYNQKKIEIERQKKWIVTFVVLIVIICIHSIMQSGFMKNFYLNTLFGNLLLGIYLLSIGVSLFLFSVKQSNFSS